jgi:hypothetical protein
LESVGVTALPALLTPNGTYSGREAILDAYGRLQRDYRRWLKRQSVRRGRQGDTRQAAPSGSFAEPSDDLEKYYAEHMNLELIKQETDEGEEGIEEKKIQPDEYRKRLQEFESRRQKHRMPSIEHAQRRSSSGGNTTQQNALLSEEPAEAKIPAESFAKRPPPVSLPRQSERQSGRQATLSARTPRRAERVPAMKMTNCCSRSSAKSSRLGLLKAAKTAATAGWTPSGRKS